MSYGQWVVDKESTINEFGYNPDELKINSNLPVRCICIDCGIKAIKRFREGNRKHICKSIIDGKKKCFKCKKIKLIDEFSKNRATFDGFQKCCKHCFANYDSVKKSYVKKTFNYKNNYSTYFSNKISHLKRKSKLKNIDFNLTTEILLKLYEKQNGKCYYTDLEIKHNKGCSQYNSISIERLDPNKGYTENNTVLACFAINSFKGMMTENEFKDFLEIIIPKLIDYKNKL